MAIQEDTKALQEMVTAVIAALGEERKAPFEVEAYYEFVDSNDYDVEGRFLPRVKLVKR